VGPAAGPMGKGETAPGRLLLSHPLFRQAACLVKAL